MRSGAKRNPPPWLAALDLHATGGTSQGCIRGYARGAMKGTAGSLKFCQVSAGQGARTDSGSLGSPKLR